jgi:hypothetical protein
MDMYGQVANTYSQELQNGVRLQAGLDQQMAQQPQQLFDRFMNAYQQEYLRRKQEQDMLRRQQHEDTYLKMAEEKDRADKAKALNAILDDISQRYVGDPAQKAGYISSLTALGKTPDEALSYIPPDTTYVPPQGESIGKLGGQDITLPQTSADIKRIPGMGGEYLLRQKAAELAAKKAEEQQKFNYEKLAATSAEKEKDRALRSEMENFKRDTQMGLLEAKLAAARGGAGGMSAGEYREAQLMDKRAERQAKIEEADRAAQAKNATVLGQLEDTQKYANDLLNDDKGLKAITGRLGSIEATDVGQEARRARATYKTLIAKNVIGIIGEMKAMSRTGATGWGAVSEKELSVMENAAAALDLKQNAEDFKKRLRELVNGIDGVKARVRAASKGGPTPGAVPKMDRQTRYNQLRSSGLSPEVAKAKLAEEGY